MAERPRDFLWEALVEVCAANADEMTKNERGKFNAALKQLRDVGATPDEIRRRAWQWKQEYPNIQITPTALCNRWSSLRPKNRYAPATGGEKPSGATPSAGAKDAWGNPSPEPAEELECRHGVKGRCPECLADIRSLVEGLKTADEL